MRAVARSDCVDRSCVLGSSSHTIPTKHLDGSTKLPDGSRVEQHIPYFNPTAESDWGAANLMEIDWISGKARFKDAANSFGYPTTKEFPTSLFSTRVTPQMSQDEYFGLTFFSDGKQARVSNGGFVSNWRYVAPGYDVDIAWFVAEAMVPCAADESAGCEDVTTTDGASVRARKRTASETENLGSISYNRGRVMKTVSKPVTIKNAADKSQSFNQRYGNKQADFGDIIMKDGVDDTPATGGGLDAAAWGRVHAQYTKWVGSVQPQYAEKQIAHYEMLKVLKAELAAAGSPLPGPYKYIVAASTQEAALLAYKAKYLNTATYDISATALCTKAGLAPSYIPTPIGETGWMVVPTADELPVPDDNGEYFIGWTILNQPANRDVQDTTNPTNGHKEEVIRWAQTHGYALHQGPGLIFLTGGDFAHGGTQEPFVLDFNEPPAKRSDETDDQFEARKKAQLPTVHWRLDKQEVILKSLEMGAHTHANVGAGQKMLASIGTRLSLAKPSRSVNFLGKYYQALLADPSKIQDLIGKTPGLGEVYEVESGSANTFIYGVNQQVTVPSGSYSRK